MIVISSIVAILVCVIASYIVAYTIKNKSMAFNAKVDDQVNQINQANKSYFSESIYNNNNTNVAKAFTQNIDKSFSDQDVRVLEAAKITQELITDTYKYEQKNKDDMSLIGNYLQNPMLDDASNGIKTVNDKLNEDTYKLNNLHNRNRIQNSKIENVEGLHKGIDKTKKNIDSVMFDLDKQLLFKKDLNAYTKDEQRVAESLRYARAMQDINSKKNTHDAKYAERTTIFPYVRMYNQSILDIDENNRALRDVEKTMITKNDLKNYKLTASTTVPDAGTLARIAREKDACRNVRNEAKNIVLPQYVPWSVYNPVADKLSALSYPMFEFLPGKEGINVKGSVGVGNAADPKSENKLLVRENANGWGAIFESGKSKVQISNGDGNGVQVSTENRDGSKYGLQVNNGTNMLLYVGNDENVNLQERLELTGSIKTNSKLCVNNTCIEYGDLTKVDKIKVHAPQFIAPLTYTLKKELFSYNLDSFFADKTGAMTFEIHSNPYNNAHIVDRTLRVQGDFRGVAYNVSVRASNQFGMSTVGDFAFVEEPRIPCKMTNWVASACDPNTGLITRTRQVEIWPKNEGTDCPRDASGNIITRETDRCRVDCQMNGWVDSSFDPINGKKTQTRTVRVSEKNEDLGAVPCRNYTRTQVVDYENDCVYGNWGPCSQSCRGSQTLGILAQARGKGKPCVTKTQACNHGCFNGSGATNTPANDWGGGNTVYLDRHNVECGGGRGIQGFNLSRYGEPYMYYSYRCTNGGDLHPRYGRDSGFNDEGGGNVIYLDRHGIDCGGDGVVSQFNLTRSGQNSYRYNYQCAKSKYPLQCRTITTNADSDGGGNVVYLDRQHVNCAADEALSYFQLYRPTGNTIAYQYRCCK